MEQIKSTLLGHEEPYEEGAWERFAAKNISTGTTPKPKPVVPIWKWAAAAAAVLAGAILLLQYFNAPDTATTLPDGGKTIVKTNEGTRPSVTDTQAPMTDTATQQIVTIPENNFNNHINNNRNIGRYMIQPPAMHDDLLQKDIAAKTDNAAITPAKPLITQQQPAQQQSQTQPGEQKPTNKPFWESGIEQQGVANNTKPASQQNNNAVAVSQPTPRADKAGKNSRWLSSIYVSPNFASEGVNMGYGYSLGYAISDKVSVSSGIAYTKVSASRDYHTPQQPPNTLASDNQTPSVSNASYSTARSVMAASYTPTTYLQSVDSWVAGIDVPVEVSYNISKKLYTSGGISGLFVLNGQNTRTTVDNMNSVAPVLNNKGNVKEYSNVTMESVPVREKSDNDKTSFLGFYNASVGFKQKVSAKNSVSVEPFIKIPMKQVTEQKLNYTGVGLRLKFDF